MSPSAYPVRSRRGSVLHPPPVTLGPLLDDAILVLYVTDWGEAATFPLFTWQFNGELLADLFGWA